MRFPLCFLILALPGACLAASARGGADSRCMTAWLNRLGVESRSVYPESPQAAWGILSEGGGPETAPIAVRQAMRHLTRIDTEAPPEIKASVWSLFAKAI